MLRYQNIDGVHALYRARSETALLDFRGNPMRPLPRVVVVLGFVSLLTDISSEMIYPLLPTLLASVGGGAMGLGAIEGVGDATASVGKLVSGKLSDGRGRKGFVLGGYALSALVRPLLAVAMAPWQIIGVRFVDRIGKGIRSSPRDALIARSVPRKQAGAAFGFHRAMDNVGATVGPLLTFALLGAFDQRTRPVVLATIVPSVLAVALIALFVREESEKADPPGGEAPARDASLADVDDVSANAFHPTERGGAAAIVPPGEPAPASTEARSALRSYLLILGVFALANTSDLFLLRRLSELGARTGEVAIVWALLSGVRALAGYPGGLLADRFGRARSMQLGYLVYALAYFWMARATSLVALEIGMIVYGLYYGLTEGAERALLAGLVPREVLGASFGRFHLVIGLAMLPSNLLFGFSWTRVGPAVCLSISADMALTASVALGFFMRRYARDLHG